VFKRLHRLIAEFRIRTTGFAAEEQGSTIVEYAILLAIIVGGLLLTIEMLGSQTSDVFARVTKGWNTAGDASPPTRLVSQNSVQPALANIDQPSAARTASWSQNAFVVLTISVLSIAWYSISHARRREGLRDKAAEAAAINRPARFVLKRQQMMRTLGNCVLELVQGRLHVRHLMTQQVTTALPTATVAELTVCMEAQDVRHLLICDREDRLLGVVSDRDLRAPLGKIAEQIMTRDPITVAATTPIMTAVSMMLDRHISSLPVIEGQRLVGILTTTDLAMALQCAIQLISQVTKPDNRAVPEQVPAQTTQQRHAVASETAPAER
jgi:CBS domain-containing protein